MRRARTGSTSPVPRRPRDRASHTAEWTALLRSLGNLGITTAEGFSDPVSSTLLSGRFALIYRLVAMLVAFGARSILRRRFGPLTDLVTLRTLAIDAALEAAVGTPEAPTIDQIVLLGAGYDARAFRLPWLSRTDVHEVDRPATQSQKIRRIGDRQPFPRTLTFINADFDNDNGLTECVALSDFDAARATAWIWEGVVMYLDDAALRTTIDAIAALSAPGSWLLTHYREPVAVPGGLERRMHDAARRRGEPQIGLRTPQSMRDELERIGLNVV